MSNAIKKKIEESMREFENKVKELVEHVEELISKGEYDEAYRLWKTETRRLSRELESKLETIEDLVDDLDKDAVEEIMGNVKSIIENILESINELGRKIGLKTRKYRLKPLSIHDYVSDITDMIDDLIEDITSSIEDTWDDLEERLERLSESFKTRQVVSVRIRENDLNIIDQLVDAGIFRSRSEAVAYFTRKGISASKQLINKVLEQAKKIKELQESIRRELEGLD